MIILPYIVIILVLLLAGFGLSYLDLGSNGGISGPNNQSEVNGTDDVSNAAEIEIKKNDGAVVAEVESSGSDTVRINTPSDSVEIEAEEGNTKTLGTEEGEYTAFSNNQQVESKEISNVDSASLRFQGVTSPSDYPTLKNS